jgi:hypothetical protein
MPLAAREGEGRGIIDVDLPRPLVPSSSYMVVTDGGVAFIPPSMEVHSRPTEGSPKYSIWRQRSVFWSSYGSLIGSLIHVLCSAYVVVKVELWCHRLGGGYTG